jgi:outer membrane lipoprotein-sorting protein
MKEISSTNKIARKTMRRMAPAVAIVCLLGIAPVLGGMQREEPPNENAFSLEEVLDRMARTGLELKSLEAALEQTRTVSFTGSRSTQVGRIYFSIDGGESRIRVSITQPGAREVLVAGGEARSYVPNVNQLTVFDLGERRDVAEYFMLGFGPGNARLRDEYAVTLAGVETIDGVPTSILELEPRSERVAAMFPTIRLWVDHESWMPVRSRINEPNGDHQIVEYSDVETNDSIPESRFELDLPSDVQIIHM